MPRPSLPPTPGSSTGFKPKSLDISPDQALSFSLGPPALSPAGEQPRPPSPISPPGTSPSARRNSSTREQKSSQTLPPPPTRSRKIIQVKPALQPAPPKGADVAAAPQNASGSSSSGSTNSNAAGSSTPAKRKQPTPTSAAGRKIARKTAHSLIERRRRSKMNEEFAVLKGMIPACAGIEMHKLAILQASIEYLRYLENCVTELKSSSDKGVESQAEYESSISTPVAQSMDIDQADLEEHHERAPSEESESSSRSGSNSGSGSGSAAQSSYAPSPAFGATISPSLYPTFNSSLSLTTFSALPAAGGSDTEAGHALMMLGTAASGASIRETERRGLRVKDLLTP